MRPAGLFKEYWRNPEATSNCIRGEWYITGDRAIRDEDGYFWFVGRADDVIISAGYRIGPLRSRVRWSSIRLSPRRRWWPALIRFVVRSSRPLSS